MGYCTEQDVYDRIGWDDSTDIRVSRVTVAAIEGASIAINNDTHRNFVVQDADVTRIFPLPRPSLISPRTLRVPDLLSITTLLVDDNDDGVFETTIASGRYELDTFHTDEGWPFEIVRLVDRDWPRPGNRRRRVSIGGRWGWAAVPSPIVEACALLVARLSARPISAPLGVQSFGELGTQSVRASDPDYMHLIGPYMKKGVA